MNKFNYILLFVFVLGFNQTQGQEEKKDSKFNLSVYGGIGYGIVENKNQPNYNLNSNSGELLLNFNLNKKMGIATGIGINELSGNGFNLIGNFYHERNLLKIPVLLTLNSKISEDFKVYTNLGFFGQAIIKDEYRFLNHTQKDLYEGWNFGAQVGMGFFYQISDKSSAGIHYNLQTDFSKFETKNHFVFSDKQRMKNLNTFGIILLINL